jgi:large subunit ribosomal protein L9
MKVILKDDVKNLGKMGDVVGVKDGYARNFLIPKGLVAPADTKNIKAVEHEKKVILERARKLKEAATGLAEKFSQARVTIKAKAGEEEKLFGSVTAMDIADALKAQGFEVDKKQISLEEPIKRLGAYSVEVKVGREVSATVSVEVVPE